MNEDKDYEQFFHDVVNSIESARANISIIKEKALLEIYWNLGEELISIV